MWATPVTSYYSEATGRGDLIPQLLTGHVASPMAMQVPTRPHRRFDSSPFFAWRRSFRCRLWRTRRPEAGGNPTICIRSTSSVHHELKIAPSLGSTRQDVFRLTTSGAVGLWHRQDNWRCSVFEDFEARKSGSKPNVSEAARLHIYCRPFWLFGSCSMVNLWTRRTGTTCLASKVTRTSDRP